MQSHWKLTKPRQSSQRRHRLVEEAKAHVVILLLALLLRRRGGLSCSGSRSSSSGSWSSCGKGAGVGQESLDGLSLLEGDLGGRGNGQQVLHAVDDAVRHRCHVGIVDGQGQSSNVSHTRGELGKQVSVGDVQDFRVKHTAAVVHLGDDQTVAEGADLEHVQEGSLGHADPIAGPDDVHVLDNLNGSLGNLSWDSQSLEEAGLLRTHTTVLGGHHDVNGGESASLGRGLHLVGEEQVAHVQQLHLGEHEANVLLDVRHQTLQVWVGLQMATDGLPHHGVLAHEDHSLTPQGNTDLLHLLGADIVSAHDEALGVLIEEGGEFGEVVGLPGSLVLPNHLECELGYLDGFKDSLVEVNQAIKA